MQLCKDGCCIAPAIFEDAGSTAGMVIDEVCNVIRDVTDDYPAG